MDIQITLEKEDWKRYQSYIERELPKHLKTWMNSFWVNMLVWMIIAFIFMSIYRQFTSFHWPTAISVGIFFILIAALFFLNLFKIRKAFEPSEKGSFCGEHFFKFTDQGIESKGSGYKGSHSWAIVKKVERVQGMILIYIDTAYAFVFPESKLIDPDGLFKYISERYSNVTNQASGTPKSGAPS